MLESNLLYSLLLNVAAVSNIETVNILLEIGACANSWYKWRLLKYFCYGVQFPLITIMDSAGGLFSIDSCSVLTMAVGNCQPPDLVELLLRKDAVVNDCRISTTSDDEQWFSVALLYASYHNEYDVVTLLLAHDTGDLNVHRLTYPRSSDEVPRL